MTTIEKMNADKKELCLDVNTFDKPKELSQVDAWSQLVLNLIFLRPGTYPSLPEMGIDIESYEFAFMDDACQKLSDEIVSQAHIYIPDVPLNVVSVRPYEYKGQNMLLIQMSFTVDGREEKSSAIAIDQSTKSRHFLDFDVSW